MKNRSKFRIPIFRRRGSSAVLEDPSAGGDRSPNPTKPTNRGSDATTGGVQSRKDDGERKNRTDDDAAAAAAEAAIPPVSQLELFRYASPFEKFLLVLGVIFGLASGCLVPATIFLFSSMVRVIVEEEYETAAAGGAAAAAAAAGGPTRARIVDAVRSFAIGNTIVGIGMILSVYLGATLFNYTGQRQLFRVRRAYFESLLRQEIGWYDLTIKTGNVATELTEDATRLEEGIGEKLFVFVDHVAVFLFSVAFSLWYGWKLTLVCLVSVPLTSVAFALVAKANAALSRRELDAFGAASSVAQEALSGIRTVVAYGGELVELRRYRERLETSRALNERMALVAGCGFGFVWFGIYASYALSQWYGIGLVVEQRRLPPEDREYDASVMIAVFFCTMIGAMNIGAVSPYLETFAVSRAAAAKIFSVIERRSAIDGLGSGPDGPDGAGGGGLEPPLDSRSSVRFEDVGFAYPARPEVQVLTGLNLSVEKGETVALVGSSGCGKSTCVQLVQRFYDPARGRVLIDGRDSRDWNVARLRGRIGVVGQEPVLFDRTIAENIRYGNPDATMDMIVAAAKRANAHEFIVRLPSKYETTVGERGVHVSGGQKQRIAIARALVRDPSILLLDEATSALDTRSESTVRSALNRARQGRTTIIVAHRLSTIRDADKIFVLSGGRVVESGKHEDLMALRGHYRDLVNAQLSEFSESPESPEAASRVGPSVEHRPEDEDEDAAEATATATATHGETEEKKIGTWRVLALNKPEWKPILVASIASVAVGSSTPLFAVLYGDVIKLLSDPRDDYVREQASVYAAYFAYAGIAIGAAVCAQLYLLTIASERLTTRLRVLAFGAMLSQEMSWFDREENGTGALCAKLSNEAAAVKGATGQRIGTVVQSIAAIALAIVLACWYEWRVGLVGAAFVPVILVVTSLHARLLKRETLDSDEGSMAATKIAVEAVGNVRTVVGLGRERVFLEDYANALRPSFERAKRNAHYRGFVLGVFKSVTCFAYAAVLYYGGLLIENGEIEFASIFKVSQALITGTVVVGQAAAFSPNLQKGLTAAARIVNLLERVPRIRDPDDPRDVEPEDAETSVSFENASFEYATRPDVKILDCLDLEIEGGRTVALVGSSGSGKSTVVKLLERFYDPGSGRVAINGASIAETRLSSLRSSLALVEQEPTVFARSIRENVAYGDNTRENVPIEEIVEAAKRANVHNFVVSLPLGYETDLGDRGAMLSGGQKQRIAVARALLRNPRVLLLDEATSALDAESEKIVQAALKEARTGRTCVVIAHRLSTIERADKICVLHRGRLVEEGTHAELVGARGLYYRMLRTRNASAE